LVTDGANYRAWVRSGEKRRRRQYDERRLIARIFEVHAAFPVYGPSLLEHKDLVGGQDRGQAVRDHDRGAAAQQRAKRGLDVVFEH